MSERKSFNKFRKKRPSISTEQKIKEFILRNSKNGFFTKVSTIPYKFEISESRAWDIVGELLADGKIESIHDEFSGEMKLCETGKTYVIMNLQRKRKKDDSSSVKKKTQKRKEK